MNKYLEILCDYWSGILVAISGLGIIFWALMHIFGVWHSTLFIEYFTYLLGASGVCGVSGFIIKLLYDSKFTLLKVDFFRREIEVQLNNFKQGTEIQLNNFK